MPFDLLVIDLDNTLYAANNGVFARMDKRMTAFVSQALDMEHAEADVLRLRYWKQYGTTLRGLILHHGVEPEVFLHDVHDIDAHELLSQNNLLDEALRQLPMRKVIHTNGICEHAERILQALGVQHHFTTVYDIRFNDYIPKPCAATLKMLLDQEDVIPARALVMDDMEDNLAVAKSIGAQTCWVSPNQRGHIWDYRADTVEAWVADFKGKCVNM